MKVRSARPADRSMIVDLCREAMGEDDYLIRNVDAWFVPGEVVVAEVNDRVVGVVRGQRLMDGSLWVSGVRVHPDFRGLGIAGMMTLHRVREAENEGVRTARMLVSAENTASLRVCEKTGFEKVLELAVYTREGREGPRISHLDGQESLPGLTREPLTMTEVSGSTFMEGMNGFVGLFFQFIRMDDRCAGRLSGSGRVFSFEGNGRFVMSPSEGFSWMTVQVIRDHPALPSRLAHLLERTGGATFLPVNDPGILRRYADAGFTPSEWAERAFVLERTGGSEQNT